MSKEIKCQKCGSDDINVTSNWAEVIIEEQELPCTCEKEEDYAVHNIVRFTRDMEAHGHLVEDRGKHIIEWDDKQGEELDRDKEVIENDVACGDCFEENGSDENQWENTDVTSEYAEDTKHVFVLNCDKCDNVIKVDKDTLGLIKFF